MAPPANRKGGAQLQRKNSIGRAGKRQGVCVCVYARVCVHVHLRAYSKHLPAAVQQQLTNSNSRAAME
eukprot:scaffold93235_cov17-Tisochrysis_lutea.AAC.1